MHIREDLQMLCIHCKQDQNVTAVLAMCENIVYPRAWLMRINPDSGTENEAVNEALRDIWSNPALAPVE